MIDAHVYLTVCKALLLGYALGLFVGKLAFSPGRNGRLVLVNAVVCGAFIIFFNSLALE